MERHNMKTEDMTKDDLEQLVRTMQAEKEAAAEALRIEKERLTRMDGVRIEYKEWTKDGVTGRNFEVAGGPFGWRGIKLTPAKWSKLKLIADDIDLEVATFEHLFTK
jgi:hypothetical protein